MNRYDKLFFLPLLLLGLVLPAAAFAGLKMVVATRFEFTNCNVDGTTTAAQAVTRGSYLFRVKDEGTWICYAATCTGTSGEWYPANTVINLDFGPDSTTTVSCRSAGSTGDLILTLVTN